MRVNSIISNNYINVQSRKHTNLVERISFKGKEDNHSDYVELDLQHLKELFNDYKEKIDSTEISVEEKLKTKKDVLGMLVSNLFENAIKVDRIPAGLSEEEEDVFAGLSQLSKMQATLSYNTRNVFIFSTAFATQNIESTLSVLPTNSKLYSQKEFQDILQRLNKVENAKLNKIIISSFTETGEICQKALISSFDAKLEFDNVQELLNGDVIETYSLSTGEKVYVEKSKNGSLKRLLRTFENKNLHKELLISSYEFEESGKIRKVTRYDKNSNILAELLIDNTNKIVQISEINQPAKFVKFENGQFFKI